MEKENKTCPICGSGMVDTGYDGDWKEFVCSDDDCSGSLLVPISDPSGDGFSMEDLESLSTFTD